LWHQAENGAQEVRQPRRDLHALHRRLYADGLRQRGRLQRRNLRRRLLLEGWSDLVHDRRGLCRQLRGGLLFANRLCNCANPAYDPSDPICADQDCQDLCELSCQDELCLKDNSCDKDADCLALGLQSCVDGSCVQCTVDDDCDTTKDETCVEGVCKKPCTANEECPAFDECQKGECVYVGCQSDRECILAASGSLTPGSGVSSSSEDARLLKCLPSEADPDLKTCKIPCENDGSCGSEFDVCDNGYCKFIGCESDEECRAYFGLQNQMTSELKPFVPKAVCRE
jgi:hypothetical protein